MLNVYEEHLAWCPIREAQWWTESPLVRPPSEPTSAGVSKGWVKVSDKVERKKWRK